MNAQVNYWMIVIN